jgi:coenzyme F420 hydrogenase subunit delta
MTRIDMDENVPAFCKAPVLILGCGNWLFGDDGFGPAVIQHFCEQYVVPETVCAMDVGTGVRQVLFTLALSPNRPRKIVLVDAVDKGRTPGEIFELKLEDLPLEKSEGFSVHQAPSTNLARELRKAGVRLKTFVCQVESIPQCVQPGLSAAVGNAIGEMCEKIVHELRTGEKHVQGLRRR